MNVPPKGSFADWPNMNKDPSAASGSKILLATADGCATQERVVPVKRKLTPIEIAWGKARGYKWATEAELLQDGGEMATALDGVANHDGYGSSNGLDGDSQDYNAVEDVMGAGPFEGFCLPKDIDGVASFLLEKNFLAHHEVYDFYCNGVADWNYLDCLIAQGFQHPSLAEFEKKSERSTKLEKTSGSTVGTMSI